MIGRNNKLALTCAAIPLLIATAALSEETPEAPGGTPEQPEGSQEDAPDPEITKWERVQARAEARKAAAEAVTAENEARAAAAGSVLGPLGSYEGAEGKAEIDEEQRSVLESTLLSSLALREAAQPLAVDIGAIVRLLDSRRHGELRQLCGGWDGRAETIAACPAAMAGTRLAANDAERQPCDQLVDVAPASAVAWPRPIVIVPESDRDFVSQVEAFEVRSASIGRELCRAIAAAGETTRLTQALADQRPVDDGERAGGSAAVLGAVANIAANLLRTDYTVYGIDLEEDQNLYLREAIRAVLATGVRNPVYAPSLFSPAHLDASNPAVRMLAILDRLSADATAAADEQAQRSSFFEQWLADAGDRTAEVQAAKDAHDRAGNRLEDAIEAYGELLTALRTQEGSEPPLMATILRQAGSAELLRAGGMLVITNVHFMGGTSYTRQNFFSSLFGMPYRVSGGVLVSYTVQDGQTGQILGARSVPVSGGFYRPTEIRAVVERDRLRP